MYAQEVCGFAANVDDAHGSCCRIQISDAAFIVQSGC
jgi:hypothetical protein